MTAYRDDAAALRHRLEIETARADRAEKKLAHHERARTERWEGDIALFLARCVLLGIPLAYAAFFALFFSAVALLDLFDDTRGLVAIYAALVSPLLVAGPLTAWKLGAPSRTGWGLALFTSLLLLAVVPPAGLFTLAVTVRGRTRDAVFGPLDPPRARVELEAPGADPAPEAAEAEVTSASRSAREAS